MVLLDRNATMCLALQVSLVLGLTLRTNVAVVAGEVSLVSELLLLPLVTHALDVLGVRRQRVGKNSADFTEMLVCASAGVRCASSRRGAGLFCKPCASLVTRVTHPREWGGDRVA